MTDALFHPDRIGIEIGGTFTDMVMAMPDGSLRTGKTLSTPGAVENAVLTVIDESGAALAGGRRLAHGSTVATNALLTRKGSATGLLTTAGFRDVQILARAGRDHNIFDMRYRHPEPPIRRRMIAEVPEHIDAQGTIITPLDLDGAWRAVQELLDRGAETIAISLLHAWRNPVHERALAAMIRERAPHVTLSLSHEVLPEFREYERSLTAVINAFVGPVVAKYVAGLDAGLKERGHTGVLQIMQSNGGTLPAPVAGDNAVRMLLSGPAAGARAAMWFAQRNGIKDAITLDMGGTSTDVAIAPNLTIPIVPQVVIDGLPVRTAAVGMETIGAGGGSIASLDEGGFLGVGPASAGAQPGPACYGLGGQGATVADAQVVVLRRYRVLSPGVQLSIYTVRFALRPMGRNGGGDGVLASLTIERNGASIAVGATGNEALLPGGIVELRLPGGGGWGDPKRRAHAAVQRDLEDGIISQAFATEHYGYNT
jgi:N-methylhydantoinase A